MLIWLRERGALGERPVQRVAFREITPDGVRAAMAGPRGLDMDLVRAQQARRALDYLVGFHLSPVLWRKLPGSRSAGRVQSVALRLVCEREAEIEAFVPREYWTVKAGVMADGGGTFTAALEALDGVEAGRLALESGSMAEAAADRIRAARFTVGTVENDELRRNPAPPFTTSSLQQEASRKLGFEAQKTMRVAQALYEGVEIGDGTAGLITYMRTGGVSMSRSAAGALDDTRWSAATLLIEDARPSNASGTRHRRRRSGGRRRVLNARVHFARFLRRGESVQDLMREYFTVYHPIDEAMPRARRLPHGRLVHVRELYTEDELKTSVAYNEGLARLGGQNGLQTQMRGPDGTRIGWVISDPDRSRVWESAQVRFMERLLPHIRRSVIIRQTLAASEALGTGLAGLLDNDRIGVVQLDRGGRVLEANALALEILRRGDGLVEGDGTLDAVLPADRTRLRRLLARALPEFLGEAPGGGSMTVQRPSGRSRLGLHVMPVGEPASPVSSGFGMSSGFTSPWMTWRLPSWPTVTMQPAIAKSSRRNTARASTAPSISSRRVSMASASETNSAVHSSSSSSASSACRVSSFAISACSSSVGVPGCGSMRPQRAVSSHETSIMAVAHFQRVASSSAAAWSFSVASFSSSTGSSNQTPPLVVPREQVAHDRAAGGLVGLNPDKAGDRGGARHPLLGQQALHLPGGRAIALSGNLLPNRHLALAVGGDGEGLQHFQVDLVGAVGVQQFRGRVAEPQPLLDDALRGAETHGDGGYRLAGVGQLREGDHLVRRVHRHADDILREREFGRLDLACLDGRTVTGLDAASRMTQVGHVRNR